MLKTMWLFHLCFLSLYAVSGAAQEQVEIITLHDLSPMALQGLSHTGLPIAISVSNEQLKEVSSSVLMAESWIRTHILNHYPSTNITTIVVGHFVLCNKNQEHKMGLVLPSIKNIYHSLTRWGLEREIKVSASFSSNCLNPNYDLAEIYVKPLLSFLQDTKSTYLVNPPPNLSTLSDEEQTLVSSHKGFMKKLGFFNLNKIKLIMTSTKESKPISRKLSFMDSKIIAPIPAIPTPLLLSPTHSPIGYSVPAYVAKSPLPPLVGTVAAPPPLPPLSTPELSPLVSPASPFHDWPPCNPFNGGGGGPVGAPETGVMKQGMWCVAKPSVPAGTLQEAMNYACGEGGADCDEIGPNGICYYPNTVVAHASYAFNSYWQKNKRNGGTCSFGGTAMIINADPSFRQCRFMLS